MIWKGFINGRLGEVLKVSDGIHRSTRRGFSRRKGFGEEGEWLRMVLNEFRIVTEGLVAVMQKKVGKRDGSWVVVLLMRQRRK